MDEPFGSPVAPSEDAHMIVSAPLESQSIGRRRESGRFGRGESESADIVAIGQVCAALTCSMAQP
jgi:hypothetical protein